MRLIRYICVIQVVVLLLLAAIYEIGAAQNQDRFSFSFNNVSLDTALHELAEKTGTNIVYDSRLTRGVMVEIEIVDKSVDEILQHLLSSTRLGYRITPSGAYLLYWSNQRQRFIGSINGTIINADDGSPVLAANVVLVNTERGAATNIDGHFTIDRLPPGQYRAIISHVKYEDKSVRFVITDNQTLNVSWELKPRALVIEQVIISDFLTPLYYMRAGQDIVDTEVLMLSMLQGTPDVLRNLTFTTGVQLRSPMADVSIQGAFAGKQQIRLDGTPVLSPASMGRFMSPFSPFAIRRLTVHKAGYYASLGSTTGGMISAQQDYPMASNKNFLIQTDPISLNARILQDYNINNHLMHVMVAGRINTPWISEFAGVRDLLSGINVSDPHLLGRYTTTDYPENWSGDEAVSFSDIHASIRYRKPDLSQTVVSFYTGGNQYNTALKGYSGSVQTLNMTDEYHWKNLVSNVSHSRLLDTYTRISGTARLSNHRFDHNYSGKSNGLSVYDEVVSNKTRFFSLDLRMNHGISDNLELDTGIEYTFIDVNFDNSDFFHRNIKIDESQSHLGSHVEFQFNDEDGFRLVAGSRLTWLFGRGIFPEPRISVGRDFTDTQAGNLSVNVAFGLFRDFMQQLELTNPAPNASLAFNRFWMPASSFKSIPRAWQAALDFRLEPVAGLILRFEPYYKRQPKTAVINYRYPLHFQNNSDVPTDFMIDASAFSAGFGLSAEKRYRNGLVNMVYNFSHSRYRIPNRFRGNYVQPDWATPHQLLVYAVWNINRNWQISGQSEVRFGRRGWAWRKAYYDYLHFDSAVPVAGLDKPDEDLRPVYIQIDLGAGWNREYLGVEWEIRFEIVNLLNQKHLYDYSTGLGNSQQSQNDTIARRYQTFQPIISISAAF